MIKERLAGQLDSLDKVLAYIGGGKGKMTLVSKTTGARFTYRFTTPKYPSGKTPIFVRLLVGQEDKQDKRGYRYLGCLWRSGKRFRYVHGRNSPIDRSSASAKAFDWVSRKLEDGKFPDKVEFWHEGVCGKCGRSLTVPESIANGLGPVCAKGAE